MTQVDDRCRAPESGEESEDAADKSEGGHTPTAADGGVLLRGDGAVDSCSLGGGSGDGWLCAHRLGGAFSRLALFVVSPDAGDRRVPQ